MKEIRFYCSEPNNVFMNVYPQSFKMAFKDQDFAAAIKDILITRPDIGKHISIEGDTLTIEGVVEGFFQGFKAYHMAQKSDISTEEGIKKQKELFEFAADLMTTESGYLEHNADNTPVYDTLGDMFFAKLKQVPAARAHPLWFHNSADPKNLSSDTEPDGKNKNAVTAADSTLYQFSKPMDAQYIYLKEELIRTLIMARATQNPDFLALLLKYKDVALHETCPPADNFWGYDSENKVGYDALGRALTAVREELYQEMQQTHEVQPRSGLTEYLCQIYGIPAHVVTHLELPAIAEADLQSKIVEINDNEIEITTTPEKLTVSQSQQGFFEPVVPEDNETQGQQHNLGSNPSSSN